MTNCPHCNAKEKHLKKTDEGIRCGVCFRNWCEEKPAVKMTDVLPNGIGATATGRVIAGDVFFHGAPVKWDAYEQTEPQPLTATGAAIIAEGERGKTYPPGYYFIGGDKIYLSHHVRTETELKPAAEHIEEQIGRQAHPTKESCAPGWYSVDGGSPRYEGEAFTPADGRAYQRLNSRRLPHEPASTWSEEDERGLHRFHSVYALELPDDIKSVKALGRSISVPTEARHIALFVEGGRLAYAFYDADGDKIVEGEF